MIAHKTKATMPGRLSHNALLKHRQITRLAAGGQTLSQRNPYAQINRVRLTYGHHNPLKKNQDGNSRLAQNILNLLNFRNYRETRELASNKHEKYSGSWQKNVKRGLEAPTKNVESCEDNQPSLRGEPLHNSLIVAQNRPFLRGAVHSITESNPVQLSGSDLAFLRWRRLISPCIAELINCPVLSPGFFTASMPSMISCAIRAVTDCDFAFFEPVAMSTFSKIECKTLYTKNYCLEVLTCKTLVAYCVSYTLFELRCVNSNAPDCWSSTEASNHNVNRSNIMACIQHTQTRPKYQYRFLALSAIGRNVIHITANTEREAREQSPAGCVMVFAGRLPVQEVRYA